MRGGESWESVETERATYPVLQMGGQELIEKGTKTAETARTLNFSQSGLLT